MGAAAAPSSGGTQRGPVCLITVPLGTNRRIEIETIGKKGTIQADIASLHGYATGIGKIGGPVRITAVDADDKIRTRMKIEAERVFSGRHVIATRVWIGVANMDKLPRSRGKQSPNLFG